MAKQDALMGSLSSNLHGFLQSIHGGLSAPNKKFLRDGFIGLIRAGHPIFCQIAREVPNQRCDYTTRVKRLDLHLTGRGRMNRTGIDDGHSTARVEEKNKIWDLL